MNHANLLVSAQAFATNIVQAAHDMNAVGAPIQAQLTQLQEGQQRILQQLDELRFQYAVAIFFVFISLCLFLSFV
jgi:hypothetical protein